MSNYTLINGESYQLCSIEKAHLQEKQQLLDLTEQLQSDVNFLIAKYEQLKAEREQDKKTIEAQAARIAELEQKPTVTVNGSYIERQTIENLFTKSLPAKRKAPKRKQTLNDPNQLSLWNATST